MNGREELIRNKERIHTTEMGRERVRKNLGLGNVDIIEWCRNLLDGKAAEPILKGKNWYVFSGDIVVTINAHSYTIITAHRMKGRFSALRGE
jgi:hypothetical protein